MDGRLFSVGLLSDRSSKVYLIEITQSSVVGGMDVSWWEKGYR